MERGAYQLEGAFTQDLFARIRSALDPAGMPNLHVLPW